MSNSKITTTLKALLFLCADPRYADLWHTILRSFLKRIGIDKRYLRTTFGGSLPFASTTHQPGLKEDIRFALEHGHVGRIAVVDHLDCAAFLKGREIAPARERELHLATIEEAEEFIERVTREYWTETHDKTKSHRRTLKLEFYLQNTEGEYETIIDTTLEEAA